MIDEELTLPRLLSLTCLLDSKYASDGGASQLAQSASSCARVRFDSMRQDGELV